MDDWRPNPGPQTRFMRLTAFEALYGGAAGGGKSEALLAEALRYVHVPGYDGLILRRTYTELEKSLIPRSHELYPRLGGRYRVQQKQWRFPSGATISFGHIEGKADQYKYQSAEFAYIAFDELTSFEEEQYLYLFSRARTTARLPDGRTAPVRVRAATNPGGVGHEWVKARFITPLRPFEVGWFARINDVDTPVERGAPGALSRVFIPATVKDNPQLMQCDPAYVERLKGLPLIERERLLNGNWDITPNGNVFRMEWFKTVAEAPPGLRWVRYWDLATSVRALAHYTASARCALGPDGMLYVADMVRGRWEWPDVRRKIIETAQGEPGTRMGIEKAGFQLAAIQELRREPALAGTALVEVTPHGDKLGRALAWSSRAEAGRLALVRGAWVPEFIMECVSFSGDGTTYDDQVDAVSGCVQMLRRAELALGVRWKAAQ